MTSRPARLPSLSFGWPSRTCHSGCWLFHLKEAMGFRCCLQLCCWCPVWFWLNQLTSLYFTSQPSPWMFDTLPCQQPLFSWCPCACAAHVRATSRCIPCPEPPRHDPRPLSVVARGGDARDIKLRIEFGSKSQCDSLILTFPFYYFFQDWHPYLL